MASSQQKLTIKLKTVPNFAPWRAQPPWPHEPTVIIESDDSDDEWKSLPDSPSLGRAEEDTFGMSCRLFHTKTRSNCLLQAFGILLEAMK